MSFEEFYKKTIRMVKSECINKFGFDYEDFMQDFYLYCFLKHSIDSAFYDLPNNYLRKLLYHISITKTLKLIRTNPEYKEIWGKIVDEETESVEDNYGEYIDYLYSLNNENELEFKKMSDNEILDSLPYNLQLLYYSRTENKGKPSVSKQILYDIFIEHKSTQAIISDYEIYDTKWFQRKIYNDYVKPYKKIELFMKCVDENKLTCFDSFTLGLKKRKKLCELADELGITIEKLGHKVSKYYKYMEIKENEG